jgi:hypothetical protein
MRQCRWFIFILTLRVLSAAAGRADETFSNSPVILENDIAWVRIHRVEEPLAEKLGSCVLTNRLIGLVLDLRFADGVDFAAARTAADALAATKLPVAILVNSQTRGAATALAADLRATRAGLVFGQATEAVSVNDRTLPAVTPDIPVMADLNDERRWLNNPYAPPARSETRSTTPPGGFLPAVDHTSEAELVRQQRQSDRAADSFLPPAPAPPHAASSPRVIHDPVLARGLDFLKGLAIVNASKR